MELFEKELIILDGYSKVLKNTSTMYRMMFVVLIVGAIGGGIISYKLVAQAYHGFRVKSLYEEYNKAYDSGNKNAADSLDMLLNHEFEKIK